MIKKIKSILGLNQAKKPNTDFSDFIHNASEYQKKKVLKEVLRQANQDQRALLEKYEQSRS